MTHICIFRPCIAKFRLHYDLTNHETGYLYRHRVVLKQPAVAKPPGQGNMAEYVDCRGDPYTCKEYAYCQANEDHAVTDHVPAQIAIRCGKLLV